MATTRTIRIATRTSALALWQANAAKDQLEAAGYTCAIVPVESTGDLQLTRPIYELGVSGVFTKQLDIALLNNEADIAVHSLKDVPTQLADGLLLVAALKRGSHQDVILIKDKALLQNKYSQVTVASSSLRRRAQWLSKYPNHNMVDIRGNVQTRLKKYYDSSHISALVLAKAGLERLNLLPDDAIVLNEVLPAPAQGIVGIVCRQGDEEMINACKGINHQLSFIAGTIERQFLRTLMGGCSVPISALAEISGNEIEFRGAIHAYDGSTYVDIHRIMLLSEWETGGKESAERLLQHHGAPALMNEIRKRKYDKSSLDENA